MVIYKSFKHFPFHSISGLDDFVPISLESSKIFGSHKVFAKTCVVICKNLNFEQKWKCLYDFCEHFCGHFFCKVSSNENRHFRFNPSSYLMRHSAIFNLVNLSQYCKDKRLRCGDWLSGRGGGADLWSMAQTFFQLRPSPTTEK